MIENEQNFQIWSNQSLFFHNLTNIHQKFYRPQTKTTILEKIETEHIPSKTSHRHRNHSQNPKNYPPPPKKNPNRTPRVKRKGSNLWRAHREFRALPLGGPPPGAFDPSTNAICNGPFARTKGSGGFVPTIADSSHNALLSYKCADCSSR